MDLVIYRMVHTTQNGTYYTNKLDVSFEEIEKEIHEDILHSCQCVSGGMLVQAGLVVLLQNRVDGPRCCRYWRVSLQHSGGRTPGEECVREEDRERK